MTPTQHTIASGITSAVFYAYSHSLPASLSCFLSGILIDVDHILDLCIYKRKLNFTIRDLFNFCEREKGGKLYLIFHSYELLAFLWVSIIAFHGPTVWLGLAIGVSVHIFLDQVANPVRPWVYFLGYRLKVGFVKEFIFTSRYFSTMDL